MLDFDVSHLPSTADEWRDFVKALTETDDYSEKHYLEMKSELDFRKKPEVAKITKFILGTANRMPHVAEEYFDGHAVMALGVKRGSAAGIERPPESKDLRKQIQAYLGIAPIGWDMLHLEGDSSEPASRVVIIVVDPPQWGDPIQVCRQKLTEDVSTLKPGHTCTQGRECPHKEIRKEIILDDGQVWFRPDGETRPATGAEIDLLMHRAMTDRPAKPEITVKGCVMRPVCHPDLVEDYLQVWRHYFAKAAAPYTIDSIDPRLYQHKQDVLRWEAAVRKAWPELVEYAGGLYAKEQVSMTVINHENVPLRRPNIELMIEGDVWAVDVVNEDEFDPLVVLPEPPEKYRPLHMTMVRALPHTVPHWDPPFFPTPARASEFDSIEYDNYEDLSGVRLFVKLEDLRTGYPHRVPPDGVLLLTDREEGDPATARWRLTAAAHNRPPYEGETALEVVNADCTGTLKRLLNWPK